MVASRCHFPEELDEMNLEPFLPPHLWLAFQEPAFLRSLPRRPVTWSRPRPRTLTHEEISLMRKWDRVQRLLLVAPDGLPDHRRSTLEALAKSTQEDRQIIDRRGANGEEDRVQWTTSTMASAVDLADLHLPPGSMAVCGGMDLEQCYHQVAVTRERAITNAIGKPAPLSRFRRAGLPAHALSRWDAGKGCVRPEPKAPDSGEVLAQACFASLPMGDHVAVEVMHTAHGNLLHSAGLDPAAETLGKQPAPRTPWTYLKCVDDFKVVATVPSFVDPAGDEWPERPDRVALRQVQAEYAKHGWKVAEKKTVKDVTEDTVLGAELRGRDGTLGVPLATRRTLIVLLLRTARLTHVTPHLMEMLLGCVTFCFLFRRPLFAVLQDSYALACKHGHKVILLPRRVAEELVLAAVLLLCACADLRAPYAEAVWALDASPNGGGIVSAPATQRQVRKLYRHRKRRGSYSKLEAPARCMVRELGVLGTPGGDEESPAFPACAAGPERPLAFFYDFLEVFAGCAALSAAAVAEGLSVGPPIEISASRWMDVLDTRVLEWLVWMVTTRRVRAISLAPPCTTFSIANTVSPIRSWAQPRGFNLLDPRTWRSNRMADFAILLLVLCGRCGVAGMDENPFTSKMRALPAWKSVAARQGFKLAEVHSCAFGAPWRKAFGILHVNIDLGPLSLRCPGFHNHVKLEGSLTKASGAYWPALAKVWAQCIRRAVRALRRLDEDAAAPIGHERPAVNLLADHLPWKVEKAWRWRRPEHINLLEQRVVGVFLESAVRKRLRGRLPLLLDSRVTLCSGAKGRSPSRALGSRWRRALPVIVGGRLYPGYLFVPTRKNPSDPPSRQRPLVPFSGKPLPPWELLEEGDTEAWDAWWAVPPCTRARAGWASLVLQIIHGLRYASWTRPGGWPPEPTATDGEAANPGPRPPNWEPRRELPAGRAFALSAKERQLRDRLRLEFIEFLGPRELDELLLSPDQLAAALVAFGQYLHGVLPRRPLADFSRTILAVVDQKRSLRRSLTAAWDYAALWRSEEPGLNRLAMPAVLLRAFVVVALHWNWPTFAAMLATGFAAMLRPSEYLTATRRLLVLPGDVQGPWWRAFIRVPLPKSRWAAARRQLARVDDWWVTQMLHFLYFDSPPHARLWNASAAAFRTRWDRICAVFRLDSRQSTGLTPASLRAGGATAHFETYESIDMLRHRARWRKTETPEIYVQEVAPYEYLAQLPREQRSFIFEVAAHFECSLHKWFAKYGTLLWQKAPDAAPT